MPVGSDIKPLVASRLSYHMSAFVVVSVPSHDMHSSVAMMANHMPASMMAAEASNNVLTAICCLRGAYEAACKKGPECKGDKG